MNTPTEIYIAENIAFLYMTIAICIGIGIFLYMMNENISNKSKEDKP